MKKLLFIFAICLTFACKKNNEANNVDLTDYNWSLSTATITPAVTVNGKSETNYRLVSNACLGYDLAIYFEKNGSYGFKSNAPACDFWQASENSYSRNENEITLKRGTATDVYHLDGNLLKFKQDIQLNGTNHTIDYIYIRKAK